MPAEHGACKHGLLLRLAHTKFYISVIRKFTVRFRIVCVFVIAGIVAFFSAADFNEFTGGRQNTEAYLRQLFSDRSNCMPVHFHPLSELADVKEIVSNLNMVIVDIAAGVFLGLIPGIVDADLPAVRYAELLIVMAIDEPNTLLSLLQMTVQPITNIAVAIEVVFSLVRIQSEKVSILFCVNTNTVIVLLGAHFALRSRVAVMRKRFAVMKDVALFPQRIDYLIKLLLKLIGL